MRKGCGLSMLFMLCVFIFAPRKEKDFEYLKSYDYEPSEKLEPAGDTTYAIPKRIEDPEQDAIDEILENEGYYFD